MRSRAALPGFVLLCLSCASPETGPAAVTPIDPPAVTGSMAPHVVAAGPSVLMTWIEPGAEGHRVRLSRLGADDAWSDPATVAAGPDFFVNWADFPSAGMASSGELMAHWLQKSGAETYAYDVRLARSRDGGATWTPLGILHTDGTRTEHGFVSLVPEGDGVRAFWLDGREMEEEGGPMTLRTALVAETIEGSEILDGMTCECCQTGAAMTSEGPVVAYRDRGEGEIRDIAIVRRAGGGWTRPAIVHDDGWEVPGCPVNGPAIAANGKLVALAWFTAAGNRPRVQVAVSRDAGASFEAPIVLDEEDPIGRVGVALDATGNPIVSWLAGMEEGSAAVRLIRVPIGTRDVSAGDGTPLTLAVTGSARASGFPRMARREEDLIVAWTDTSSLVRAALVRVESVPFVTMAEVRGSASSEGRDAPVEYAANDLDGKRVALSEMRGGPVLLNFWATWCTACREEAPVLARLHEREGLTVVGVSLDDASSLAAVRAFVREHEVPYLNLHDPEDLASRVFRIPVLPLSLLIDAEGRVVWRRDGVILAEDPDLESALLRLR